MVSDYTGLTIYKDEAEADVAEELDDLRTQMLRDLEVFLSDRLPPRSGPSTPPFGKLSRSSVGRRIRA